MFFPFYIGENTLFSVAGLMYELLEHVVFPFYMLGENTFFSVNRFVVSFHEFSKFQFAFVWQDDHMKVSQILELCCL